MSAVPPGVPPGPPPAAGPAGYIAVPPGTELASAGRRVGAWFLAIPLSIITLGIGYVIWGAIVWARGTTPALQVLGMYAVRDGDAQRASWWRMLLRETVGRFVDGVLGPITGLLSLIFMFTRDDRKTLHDMVAGTIVVRG